MLNIVTRISRKLRFPSIYNGIVPIDFRRGHPTHLEQLQSFVQNIYTQTFVEIDGLHSIFGSYGISAVSIIGNPAPNGKNNVKIGDMAPFIEACFRSLNNLNEKMHDSWFLYYLLFADKFVTFSMFEPFVAFLIFIMGFCVSFFYYSVFFFDSMTFRLCTNTSVSTISWFQKCLFTTIYCRWDYILLQDLCFHPIYWRTRSGDKLSFF